MVPSIEIDYQSEGFGTGASVSNGTDVLVTSWDELLWSAVTVGRPNRQYAVKLTAGSWLSTEALSGGSSEEQPTARAAP